MTKYIHTYKYIYVKEIKLKSNYLDKKIMNYTSQLHWIYETWLDKLILNKK